MNRRTNLPRTFDELVGLAGESIASHVAGAIAEMRAASGTRR